jgi:hypothetical protein
MTRAFVGYDEERSARFWGLLERLIDRWKIELTGVENVPAGRALFVMNHAFGWDAMLPMAAIRRQTGRRVWALGEHLWWKVPFLRGLAAAVGTVDGSPENVDALLANDELVLVLPGGLREAVKAAGAQVPAAVGQAVRLRSGRDAQRGSARAHRGDRPRRVVRSGRGLVRSGAALARRRSPAAEAALGPADPPRP